MTTLVLRAQGPIAGGHTSMWEKARIVPLAVILIVQTVLTDQLMHLGYASGDEARYIYAGHQLIHEFWHGGGSPYFETYFSGAPDFYSPVAAIADHFGGLAGVRLMSTVFMLATTGTLYATTQRLFGYLAAILAAGLFAGLGLTHVLGAYADYDSLALMLTAAAVYAALRTAQRETHAAQWLLAVPILILAANAAKYMTIVFDPAVIVLAALQLQEQGWRQVVRRAVALCLAVGIVLLGALYLAGTAYESGILFTTLNRPSGTQVIFRAVAQSSRTIAGVTWSWEGLVIALSVAGPAVALARRRDRRHIALLIILAISGLLVTIEGLHLHTTESMKRHDDFSAWFACMGAGYALASIVHLVRYRYAQIVAITVAAGLVIFSAVKYNPYGPVLYPAHTVQKQIVAFHVLEPYLARPGSRFLLGGLSDDLMLYTDHLGVPWYDHFDDVYIKYPIPGRGGDSHGQTPGLACQAERPGCMYLEGPAGYRAAIHAHWFALITMLGQHGDGLAQDAAIEQVVEHTAGYVLLTRADGQPTWIYEADYKRSTR